MYILVEIAFAEGIAAETKNGREGFLSFDWFEPERFLSWKDLRARGRAGKLLVLKAESKDLCCFGLSLKTCGAEG